MADRLQPVFVSDETRAFEMDAVSIAVTTICLLGTWLAFLASNGSSSVLPQHIYPPEYEGHFESLLLSSEEIRQRVKELAQLIHEDYKGRRPVLMCTLKGACPFFTHLSDALQDLRQGYDVEFLRASSYEGTNSTGDVQLVGELKVETIQYRHLLIIEDIVDTGTTLAELVPLIKARASPASLEVCTLLDKRLETKKFSAHYCGFSIPNHFVIGYGLDYNELYRDLKDIFCISKAGIAFDAKKLHA